MKEKGIPSVKILRFIILLVGVLTLFLAGLSGLVIVGVGPGSVERAIAAPAAAVAGAGMTMTGIKLARPG